MPRKKICSCGNIIPDTETCSCRIAAKRRDNKQKAINNAELTKDIQSRKWRKFRQQIIDRDGGYCQRCLIKYNIIESSYIQVHHIKPRSKYPELTFTESNCITLCRTCNTQLGVQEELDFEFKTTEREFTL